MSPITERTHVRLTLVNLIAGLVFAGGVIFTLFQFYGDERERQANTESRLSAIERQTRAQWESIAQNSAISDKVSRIDERTETIMQLLREPR